MSGAAQAMAIEVSKLSKRFVVSERRAKHDVWAVRGVSFSVAHGGALGLVGESGSGKSTTARLVLRLIEPTTGSVRILGREWTTLAPRELRAARAAAQPVFQDVSGALSERLTVAELVAEPLRIHGRATADLEDVIARQLESVGLSADIASRYQYELSGGQRQRVGIARALALDPALLVLDEPVSALDVSTQSQVVNLLTELRRQRGLSYLLISHDLEIVRHVSDHIAVMYLGRIVEYGLAETVYSAPRHPYTQALLSAVATTHVGSLQHRRRIVLSGEVPSPLEPPPGCAFHTRCPYVMDICRTVDPADTTFDDGGTVSCHLHAQGPRIAGGSVDELLSEHRPPAESQRR